jgi:hypothetical protein
MNTTNTTRTPSGQWAMLTRPARTIDGQLVYLASLGAAAVLILVVAIRVCAS